MIDDLLPLLPECDHYCEPFAGSLSILLNRKPSPIETANDLNGDLVNFFRVLRGRSGRRLLRELRLTPYSREEFELSWIPCDDHVERARRFYLRISMDIAKAGKKTDKSWASNVRYCKGEHSYGPENLMKKVAGLDEVVARLKMVQVENRPAIKVMKKYDTPNTLFYCDPPYLHETRTSKADYLHEMTLAQHLDLVQVLSECRGMVALSGYDHPIMTEVLSDDRWHKTCFSAKQVPMSKGKGLVRQECLWTNYDPIAKQGQLNLFTKPLI